MTSVIKVKANMDIIVAVSTEQNIEKLTNDQEAKVLVSIEQALNNMKSIELGDLKLHLRAHLR